MYPTEALRRMLSAGGLRVTILSVLVASPVWNVEAQVDGLFREVAEVEPSLAAPTRSVPSEIDDSGRPGGATLQGRRVRTDLERLARIHAGGLAGNATPQSLELNLFDDVVFTATVERTALTSSGGYSLSGSIDGVDFGRMTLVVNGDVMAGVVHTPLVTYELRPLGDGVSMVRQVDRSFECELVHTALPVDARGDPSAAGADDGSVIDLLVVYTPAARSGSGGTSLIEALIDLAVADLNRALEDSGVVQRMNMVGKREVAYTEPADSSGSTMLSHLANPADGYLDEVHPLRDGLRADLVHLIQASSFRGGRAEVLGPFGATHYDLLGGLVPHELGHNMGLLHDRYNDASNHPFPYSHGYVNQAAFAPGAPYESRFATIMAYNSQCGDAGFFCPWANTFSNPDMTYNGYPMGVRGDAPSSAVDGPADARRSLNELRTTVANFRVRGPGPDLVAQSPVVTDSTLRPNQAFRLTASVRNIGDRASAGTTIAYYRSPDSTISAADTLVRTGVLAGLGRGETRRASIEVTAPAQPGIYYYGACVRGVGDETAVANNCSWGAWVVVGSGMDTECRNDLGVLRVPGRTQLTGSWNDRCGSTIYYDFTLGHTASVTIDLTSSSVNTFLFLRKSDGGVTERDRSSGSGTNARITRSLESGRYTVWADGYPSWVKGPFVLTVVTADPGGPPEEPGDPTRTVPPMLDVTCHGYDEGAARAYNCIPEPSQQHHMRTFVPAVGSACDQGSIAEFPAGRIVFQIRCRDGSSGQSAAWSYAGRGRASFAKPMDTPRVWLRTSFSGSSAHLSVWCRAPQEYLAVNELLGTSWGNDGTNGNYGMAGCREVEVDAGAEDLQWWFAPEPAATALTPPRSWERVTGEGSALVAEALQDLAAAAELERDWGRPGRRRLNPGRDASTPDEDTDALDGPSLRNAVRTSPLTLDLTCHGYDEGATRAYNCIPVASQQRHMRTFVPAVGSACDGGRVAEFPAGRIVFQIRCRDAAGQSAAWSQSGRGAASFVKPADTPRVWVRSSFSGSSAHLSVRCGAPRERLVVNELLGKSWGNDGTNGIYGMAGCSQVEVDTGAAEDVQWWFTQEPADTALWPPRSWEQATGLGGTLSPDARRDLDAAVELERLWPRP